MKLPPLICRMEGCEPPGGMLLNSFIGAHFQLVEINTEHAPAFRWWNPMTWGRVTTVELKFDLDDPGFSDDFLKRFLKEIEDA